MRHSTTVVASEMPDSNQSPDLFLKVDEMTASDTGSFSRLASERVSPHGVNRTVEDQRNRIVAIRETDIQCLPSELERTVYYRSHRISRSSERFMSNACEQESKQLYRQGYTSHIRKRRLETSYTSYNTPFGTFQSCTETFALYNIHTVEERAKDVVQTETHFQWHPASWLLAMGWNNGVRFSNSGLVQPGLNLSLNTYRAVPDDSFIFELCRVGNIEAVGKLIESGKASVWDTNSKGWTPFHVSSICSINQASSNY